MAREATALEMVMGAKSDQSRPDLIIFDEIIIYRHEIVDYKLQLYASFRINRVFSKHSALISLMPDLLLTISRWIRTFITLKIVLKVIWSFFAKGQIFPFKTQKDRGSWSSRENVSMRDESKNCLLWLVYVQWKDSACINTQVFTWHCLWKCVCFYASFYLDKTGQQSLTTWLIENVRRQLGKIWIHIYVGEKEKKISSHWTKTCFKN